MFDGSFYPNSRVRLSGFITSAMEVAKVPAGASHACAYVAPHAGYMYSGKTAAFTYRALRDNARIGDIDTIVLVGPNHTGSGKPIAVSMEDWETPLGISINDRELSAAIVGNSKCIDEDELAHMNEHSLEVQLPFLRIAAQDKRVALICMADQGPEASDALSRSIMKAAESLKRKVIVIASSDLNHYESAETAKRKDSVLLEAAKALDYRRFNRLVHEVGDSACGFGPMTVAMSFAKRSGAASGIVMKYCNSGDTNGDYGSVVAYPSISFG